MTTKPRPQRRRNMLVRVLLALLIGYKTVNELSKALSSCRQASALALHELCSRGVAMVVPGRGMVSRYGPPTLFYTLTPKGVQFAQECIQ